MLGGTWLWPLRDEEAAWRGAAQRLLPRATERLDRDNEVPAKDDPRLPVRTHPGARFPRVNQSPRTREPVPAGGRGERGRNGHPGGKPAGLRSASHGRTCSKPHSSMPASRRRPPLPQRTRIAPRPGSRSCSLNEIASWIRSLPRQRTAPGVVAGQGCRRAPAPRGVEGWCETHEVVRQRAVPPSDGRRFPKREPKPRRQTAWRSSDAGT
jgi:hypothetical protein